MADEQITTKVELLKAVDHSWAGLNAALDALSVEQRGIVDENGWNTADHLVHLAAWERSVVYFLQGKPRYEGLGVSESVYLPDEPGEGDGPPAMNVIYGNTAHHFAEHLGWIQALSGDL